LKIVEGAKTAEEQGETDTETGFPEGGDGDDTTVKAGEGEATEENTEETAEVEITEETPAKDENAEDETTEETGDGETAEVTTDEAAVADGPMCVEWAYYGPDWCAELKTSEQKECAECRKLIEDETTEETPVMILNKKRHYKI